MTFVIIHKDFVISKDIQRCKEPTDLDSAMSPSFSYFLLHYDEAFHVTHHDPVCCPLLCIIVFVQIK